MADISLTAAVDASLFDAGLDKMKTAAAVKSRAMVSELDKIAAAEARISREAAKAARGPTGAVRGGAFGGRNAGYMGGQLAMQAQDVAVMAQMGMSTSRIIMQQGTQIASIFGPKGMIAGGLLAVGALVYDHMSGTADAAEKAKLYTEQLALQKAHMREMAKEQRDIDAMRAGDTFEFLGNEPKLGEFGGGFAPKRQAEMIRVTEQENVKRLELEHELQDKIYDIRLSKYSVEQQTELMGKATERSILKTERLQSQIVQRNKDEVIASAAEVEAKRIATLREWETEQERLHYQEMGQEKEQADEFTRIFEAEDEANTVRRENRIQAEIAGEARIAAARQRVAASGGMAYDELKGSTFGKSSLDKQRERNVARRQERLERKWEAKMDKTGGLTGIQRGMGGEIESGIDPMTGKRVPGWKARRNWEKAKLGKLAADTANAILAKESIDELVAAIADLLPM